MKTKFILIILLPVLFITISSGQKTNKKVVISGHIKDSLNNPVKGAYIFIDNIFTKISTNDKGFYKIKASADADTISVITSSNGIAGSAIDGRTTINFSLTAAASHLQNIKEIQEGKKLVDIGYGVIGQDDLSSSVSSVDGKNQKYDSYGSIQEMLKGTPGVQVIPGDGLIEDRIIVQGQSSISHPTEPMFVVDGIPRESINDILPSMVENISVLKGSSATIYGSRGAFGVILINLVRTP